MLGALLLSAEARDDVMPILSSGEFYADAHQRISAVIFRMADEDIPIDVVTVAEDLERRGELADVGGVVCLAQLLEDVPIPEHAAYYAGIIREKFRLRSLREAFTKTLHDLHSTNSSSGEILEQASSTLGRIQEIGTGESAQSLHDILIAAFDQIGSCGLAEAIPTGYADLDQKTCGGLRGGNLMLVAARPGAGKTTFALNMMLKMSRLESRSERPRHCLFFSMEQGKLEVAERLLSAASSVSSRKLRGELDDTDRTAILRSSSDLSALPIVIDDQSDQTISRMLAIGRRVKRRRGLMAVFVDYLQLITPADRRVPREQQVAQLSRDLKNMARQLEVPVVCLAQLNREVDKRQDRRPQMSHLRESGALEADADLIGLLWRPADAPHPEVRRDGSGREYGDSEVLLLIEKHRNGETGTIELFWNRETFAFHDMAREPSPFKPFASYSDGF